MTDEPNPQALVPLTDAAVAEIIALAKRAEEAHGALMKLVAFAGSKAENLLETLPDAVKDSIESATASALHRAYQAPQATAERRLAPDPARHSHAHAAGAARPAGRQSALPPTVSTF